MVKYTSDEMLAAWRRALGLETTRTDCTVTAFEGIDVDSLIRQKMRRWYVGLLDRAPLHLVPVECYVDVQMSAGRDGWGTVSLPAGARRPLEVMLTEWHNPARVLAPEEAAPAVARMASPYGLPGTARPLAVLGSGCIRVYPAKGKVERLIAVADPGPDAYVLDESLMASIEAERLF